MRACSAHRQKRRARFFKEFILHVQRTPNTRTRCRWRSDERRLLPYPRYQRCPRCLTVGRGEHRRGMLFVLVRVPAPPHRRGDCAAKAHPRCRGRVLNRGASRVRIAGSSTIARMCAGHIRGPCVSRWQMHALGGTVPKERRGGCTGDAACAGR